MSSPPTGEDGNAAMRTTSARARSAVRRARTAAGHYAVVLEPTAIGRFWSRLLEVEFIDRSVALAAKLLVSFFPLLIVVAAISPDSARQNILTALVSRFGLSGESLEMLRASFATPDETRNATGIIGVLVVIAFAISFTTALQRVYLRAWRRPSGGGMANKGRGATWVAGVVTFTIVLALVRSLVVGPAGSFLSWVVGMLAGIGLWWWTAHLMLRGEVRWRPLLPTAIVTGLGSWLYTLAASVWFPTTVAKNFAQFGAFGVGLSFVTWFTGLAFLVVGAAVVAPALADGEDRVARWVRRDRPSLVPGAAPALPGPSRPMRLSDAFGRGGDRTGTHG